MATSLEASAIKGAQALGVTLTGDKVQDDNIIMDALHSASEAQKEAFYAIRYGASNPRGYADANFSGHQQLDRVVVVNTSMGSRKVDIDDPSLLWARPYLDGLNQARAKTSSELSGLFDKLLGDKPTASANVAYGGYGSMSISRDPGGSRISFDGGSENDDSGFVGSDDPVRPIKPPGRARDIPGLDTGDAFTGALPIAKRRAVLNTLTDTGDTGGTGGSGGGSGSGSGSGTGSGSGGTSGAGSGSGTDSTINRLIDLVASQYSAGGGGSAGGVTALPTGIATTDATPGGSSKAAIVFVFIGIGVLAWWWFKHKKPTANA